MQKLCKNYAKIMQKLCKNYAKTRFIKHSTRPISPCNISPSSHYQLTIIDQKLKKLQLKLEGFVIVNS